MDVENKKYYNCKIFRTLTRTVSTLAYQLVYK